MTYTAWFHHLGHDAHGARREQLEREQRAIDEARIAAATCPMIEDDGE